MRIPLYQQGLHSIVIAGFQISDFFEGDWLEIAPKGNAASRTEGGDGPSMNYSVAQGGQITISLKPTSPALGALYSLRESQAILSVYFPISIITGVQELVIGSGCGFGELPGFTSGGTKMTVRKFLFECLSLPMDTSAVQSIIAAVAASLL